ncbi:microbial collagenase [Bacillus thuringiensis serovar tolworthi]|uniref:microbial collagenase n=1 Tax=Bacillus thuringiensis subsp. tolworthi TaxID=1442 RepID=A0A9W3ZVD3_BACTO|nr:MULTISPECIES: S8 family serine peptidase [Bacillus cereus group]MEB8717213.1 S8 family serine peptidase [Bacillus cereus]MRB04591.1 S8 family serine peptidase [Bacillus thuringiensis]MEB9434689.1 S8 family serine peptidase [Bacillus cereus]MEB9481324.1 S8 family serine peptidase [Bacillus cereus]MEB9595487.1 S8 family serine peptidase [Bacillus cereus]
MKIFQKMCASTVIITTLLGTGGIINSVYADSIEQQSKLGIEQETDKQIIVKFKADLDLPYEDGIEKQIQSQTNDKIIKDLLTEYPDVTFTRLFTSVSPEQIQNLEVKAPNHVSTSLLNYYILQNQNSGYEEEIVDKLKASSLIEDAYMKKQEKIMPPEVQSSSVALNPNNNPRFKKQGYLEAAPYGINAPFAWGIQGGNGNGITFVDMEYGWLLNHEDLLHQNIELMSGRNIDQHVGHGTSVLGIVSSEDNEVGNIGIAPKAKAKVISQIRDNGQYNTADAILSAVNQLEAGDVLLLEAQASFDGYGDKYLPVEVQPDIFDAIRAGTDKGIVIIEAGANGWNDLDQFKDRKGKQVLNRNSKDFKDSGAIMVGAGSSSFPHERMWFSNYGSRIDVYGWGENVDTTTAEQSRSAVNLYTSSFSGTSSASPIIAGAATLVQSIAKENLGQPYRPSELRAILSNQSTGTKSKDPYADKIGVLPDLKSILVNLGYEQRKPNGGNELQVTENEPNNEPRQANKVNFHTPVKGMLHNSDRVDVFTFQIDSPENINISLLNEQNIGMTWVLHHESDLNNYVAYGENEGNVVKGTYNAKPGKYYLYVYKYENTDGSYVLNIK